MKYQVIDQEIEQTFLPDGMRNLENEKNKQI